ncbi:glycosyltransferase family 1 protein [Cohnella sp. REN36]|uniref:glycosyltransferase family 1 protein n=1 Tax=Cohnella sp. REN36 TaxID=2887347 RepID=UPI001D14C4CD|nr:glycosyltransferase family 1 protein [Cohnella sp. REN36]MCC3375550.1 glycosyltransferase family 1 protein [Cohnella sp. REN36]
MNRRIKVLHIVGKMHPGGIETLLMNIYRHIDRSKYEFHFGVQTEEKAFYDDEIAELGGKIVRQPHPKEGLWAYRRALVANIREHGPYDAIHSHIFGFSGYVLKVAKELGVPVRISHSHNTQDSRRTNWLRSLYRAHMRRLIRSHATGMLGCSNEACESLFGGDCWRDERVKVFPNAIDPAPYAALQTKRSALKSRLDLPDDAVAIGHIGRFSPQKNHAFLLERFADFRRVRPEAYLILIGDGPLRAQIEAQAAALGLGDSVRFLGVRKDVPQLLGALDLFVLPSLYEGLGIVLIEAQAAGVPCLVSDRVPPAADLGIGLMKRLSLTDGAERWTDLMLRLTGGSDSVDWPSRHQALMTHGYDIGQSVQRLERMYGG